MFYLYLIDLECLPLYRGSSELFPLTVNSIECLVSTQEGHLRVPGSSSGSSQPQQLLVIQYGITGKCVRDTRHKEESMTRHKLSCNSNVFDKLDILYVHTAILIFCRYPLIISIKYTYCTFGRTLACRQEKQGRFVASPLVTFSCNS